MSDWKFLNANRVTTGPFASDEGCGCNGFFQFEVLGRPVKVIASDGGGWQHVSVSQVGSNKPPSWDVMCAVKDLFFEPDQWVMQFHPAQSEYVNNHPGCLHLWRPTEKDFPVPRQEMVGNKNWNGKMPSKVEQLLTYLAANQGNVER